MTQEALTNPKVFISYSWTNEDYRQWIVDLAKRLVHDGVDVVIDVWDLVEGQDKYVFMEQMVKSSGIEKVLIMCDEKYKLRADEREGGVGDETQIISSDVYDDVKQEKFIPIVATRDENGESFIPNYIKSRIYIDLSDEDSFEENYDRLIRNIYKVPLHQKPKLGSVPSYILEREIDHFQTSVVIKRMESLLDKYPNRLKNLAVDFKDKLIDSLEQFTYESVTDKELDDIIIKNIESMTPLRDDYISMIRLLCEAEVIESEYIIEFFEEIFSFSEFKGNGTYNENQLDHYNYFIHELFLLTVMILLRYREYNTLGEIVNADFYIESQFHRNESENYTCFRLYLRSLDVRNSRLKLNRISIHADLLVQGSEKYKKELVEADLLLYYISKIHGLGMFGWFPVTFIYFKNPFKFFSRMSSKRYFETVKAIFNVDTKEEFIEKAKEIEYGSGYTGGFHSIPRIESFIKLEQIATKA